MNGALAYGIDFGTSNSSLSVAYEDRVEVVELGGTIPSVMPSIVYLHRDGNRAAGEDAVQQYLVTGSKKTSCSKCSLVDHDLMISDCGQYKQGEGCLDSRLPVSVKSELAQPDFVSTHSWAHDFSLQDLVAVVLKELKRRGDRYCGADVRRLVLGHPVAFVGSEGPEFVRRQDKAEDRLQEAAALAGFEEVVLVAEPAAAVIDEQLEAGIAMAVDFGGGTFDVAIIEFTEKGGEVIALEGAEVGGELFDKVLFESKVAPALGFQQVYTDGRGKERTMPHWFKNRFFTLGDAMHLLSDPSVPGLIREYKTFIGGESLYQIEEILYGGQAYNFYKAVEKAKIELSSSAQTTIEVHRPGINISVPVRREEFEALIAPHLEVIFGQIQAALDSKQIDAGDVSLVLRTGGSSSIPAFVEGLESMFGAAMVSERPVYTTVVHGLGTYAQMEWST